MRLNTYTTEPVSQVDQMVLDLALVAPVIAVASPSAIRAWVSLIPEGQQWDNAVACIGETTALVAKKFGLKNVFFPANPGIEGMNATNLKGVISETLLDLLYPFGPAAHTYAAAGNLDQLKHRNISNFIREIYQMIAAIDA